MVFSEIYGVYYQAVAAILKEAVKGSLDEKKARKIVREMAFSESWLTIVPALKEQRWPLTNEQWGTPLTKEPTRPLTLLERRWMKAISLDPRFRLFGIRLEELDGVEPLFVPEDFVVFDRCADGDPYGDPAYQERFRILLAALKEGRLVEIRYQGKGKSGRSRDLLVEPVKLEYSEKDDKFRLIANGRKNRHVLNLARMETCRFGDFEKSDEWPVRGRGGTGMRTVVMEVEDERNGLERVLLHFAHFEKEAERLDDRHYRVTVRYDQEDETELLIRVLSFGSILKVVGPDRFAEQIRDRLRRQKSCGLH